MPSLHIHSLPLFQVELVKDGWEQLDMLWCHSAQNIGLSNHTLKSALTYTVCHNARPFQAVRRTNITAIARRFVLGLTNASRAKTMLANKDNSCSGFYVQLTVRIHLTIW